MRNARKRSGHGIPLTVHKTTSSAIPPLGGSQLNLGKCTSRWLRPGTARLTLAVFFLLGLMFGTSLGYLASAALRAAKSTLKMTRFR